MSLINEIEKTQKKELPALRTGDQVKVFFKVIEGASERIQPFEGIITRKRGFGMGESFTVRKISYGIGVERIFPVSSPRIQKVEVLRHGKVRRAKLYYLRALSGKAARISAQEEQ
jgi:large subunit ribosomal protein L19